eukprot:1222783-Amphidinium_carterae.1
MSEHDKPTTTLTHMSMHYAPDFFKTLKDQKRDEHDLRAQDWDEAQVRAMETNLQGQQLMELYTVIPEKALQMWIACGRIPTSYMKNCADPRHQLLRDLKEEPERKAQQSDMAGWYARKDNDN